MRAWPCTPAALLVAGCVAFVTPPPRVVQPDTRLDCTDTYWLPAADAAASAALLAYAAWVAYKIDKECSDDNPEGCDPQGGIAVGLPLVAGVGLAFTAAVGRHRVSRCRSARAWQRETSLPPSAGAIGAACVPVYDGEGRCKTGDCVGGVCRPALPPSDGLRRTCAEAKGRWRAGLLTELPPACRSRER